MRSALMNARQSCGLESRRSPSNACAQRGAINCVSDIGRSRLNRALGIMGRYLAASGHTNKDSMDKKSRDVGSLPT